MQHIFKFLPQFKCGLNALAKSIRDDMTVKVLICTNELLNLGKRKHICLSPKKKKSLSIWLQLERTKGKTYNIQYICLVWGLCIMHFLSSEDLNTDRMIFEDVSLRFSTSKRQRHQKGNSTPA